MTGGKWSERAVLELVALAYDASAEPQAWPVFFQALAGAAGAAAAALMPHDTETGAGRVFASAGIDVEWAREYEETWGRMNPWVVRGAASRFPGSVRTGEMVLSADEFERSEFYQGFLRPISFYHSLGACVGREGSWVSICSLLRPRRSGPFDAADIQGLSALVPHMRRALEIHTRLAGAEWLADAQAAALDSLAFGCLVLDRNGAVLSANRAARDFAARADGLSIRGGLLCAAAQQDTARLRVLTHAAGETIAGRGLDAGGALPVARPSGRRPWNVLVLPFRGSLAPSPGRPQPAAIVFIADPDARPAPAQEVLADLFGLTAAEGRVAAALLDGDSPEAAAERLGLSGHTVRNQLKSIFSKTGTRRQAELVKLFLSGLAPVER